MMKRLLYILLCVLPGVGWGQIITTVAGGGSNNNDNIPATSAAVYHPIDLEFDKKGNLFVCSGLGHVIRMIDTNGLISTIAGTGSGGYNGDGGLADTSKIKNPGGFCLDSLGNVFIADKENHRIRKVNVATGIITTVAGTGVSGFNGDYIQAQSAQLSYPADVCFDRFGNLFISEHTNLRIRKVDPSGIITTYVGTGLGGYSGDGGLATLATVGLPQELTTDTMGNLFFSDFGNTTSSVRKVNRVTGIITTIAGLGAQWTFNGDNIPATTASLSPTGICFDEVGNFYIGDWMNNRIRMIDVSGIIHTVAGDGTMAFGGDGGPATAAQLNRPVAVRVDSCGNLYTTEINQGRIRKVSFNPYCWPLSVNEVKPLTFTLSPNPATSQITISSANKLKEVSIRNMLGQRVVWQRCATDKVSVDVEGLLPGVYFVEVRDVNCATRTEKIIKQ